MVVVSGCWGRRRWFPGTFVSGCWGRRSWWREEEDLFHHGPNDRLARNDHTRGMFLLLGRVVGVELCKLTGLIVALPLTCWCCETVLLFRWWEDEGDLTMFQWSVNLIL